MMRPLCQDRVPELVKRKLHPTPNRHPHRRNPVRRGTIFHRAASV